MTTEKKSVEVKVEPAGYHEVEVPAVDKSAYPERPYEEAKIQ